MTNDNTRTKANAVFFSVLMVLSMVAVGFAAAPAAAQITDGNISMEEQGVGTNGNVSVTVDNYDDTADSNASVVLTYENSSGNTIFAGSNNSTGINNSTSGPTTVAVPVDDTEGTPGDYTVHLFNQSYFGSNFTGASPGDSITLSSADQAARQDTATATIYSSGPDRTAGDDVVFNGTTVYQGEDDLTFVDDDGSTVTAGELQKTAGDAEGTSLNLPISTDQSTGTYATDSGFEVIVQEPRITTSEVQLNNDDISSVGTDDADNLDIVAEWNFNEAEDLSIEVQDPSGADITDEVVNGTSVLSGSGEQSTSLEIADEDAGEYTVIFEGNDDLDYGGVVQEYTIELTSQDTVSIDTAQDTVTQGTNVDFTVSGGTNGEYHMVVIESDDFRNNNIDDVFRNVEDVAEVGFADDSGDSTVDAANATYAYAVVEIDGTQGVGSIRSASLDDTSVSIDVYEGNSSDDFRDITGESSVDDITLTVDEGDLTINSPGNQYVIGSEVDINGTASSADAVDVYVRDNNDWQLLLGNINVDADDEYEEEDVDLTATGETGASILSQAGSYRFGVVDRSVSSGEPTLTTSEFSSATSASQSITTTEGDLGAELGTINGQINNDIDNDADITGVAEGQSSVALIYVDRRGGVAAVEVDVDSDGTIDESDVPVPSLEDDSNLGQLAEGAVTAHFVSSGRDSNIGDGELPGGNANNIGGLVNYVNNNVSDQNLNAAQARSLIVSETTDDTASDDLMVTQSFRYVESQTTIDSVYPEGSEAAGINPVATGDAMVVAGTTNLRPDDNSITVELLDSDGESVLIESTDTWEASGGYTVTIDTADFETGTYTVEADDGTNTDRAEIELVESVEEETTEEETEEETTEEETTEEETTEEETEEETTEEETTEEETTEEETTEEEATDDSTPGFGALVALVALVAAALLATRRRDE